MSLATNLPISRWIFCEESPENGAALKVRVNKYYRGKNVQLLEGTASSLIDKLRFYVPPSKGKHKVAVFCLADPYALQITMDTLEQLRGLGFNFLIPYTFHLNDRVDYRFYLREYRNRLAKFLGGEHLVDQLEEGLASNLQFYKRLVRIHQNSMLAQGFSTSLTVHKFESALMQMPVFYMGLYSAVSPARTVQREVQAGTHVQYALF